VKSRNPLGSAAVHDSGGVVTTLSDITSGGAAEKHTRRLADEQSALRAIATLVAAEALFAHVTREVARLLGAPSAPIVRYEDDGRATIVGGWTHDAACA
jgi:hypothetical protein